MTGESSALITPTVNTGYMNEHLRFISEQVGPGRHVVRVLDQAGWHVAKALRIPSKPEPKDHIVTAIGYAYHWHQLLKRDNNLTIKTLANQLGTTASRIHKYLPLINLSPTILKRALTGHLSPSLTLINLLQAVEQLDWQAQRLYLNLDESSHPG